MWGDGAECVCGGGVHMLGKYVMNHMMNFYEDLKGIIGSQSTS